MEVKNVRTSIKGEIQLCEHITIHGASMEPTDGAEYYEYLKIKCEKCGVTHAVEILIN